MLTLPIKRQWYDMILCGQKREEYREDNPYYRSRFEKLFDLSPEVLADPVRQKASVLRLRNGYNAAADTMAERVMTWFGGRKNTPRKNSYLYLDSVDACFFYSNFGTPTVTLTARWSCGAKDLDRLADAAELIKTMLQNMKVQTEKVEAPKNEEAQK